MKNNKLYILEQHITIDTQSSSKEHICSILNNLNIKLIEINLGQNEKHVMTSSSIWTDISTFTKKIKNLNTNVHLINNSGLTVLRNKIELGLFNINTSDDLNEILPLIDTIKYFEVHFNLDSTIDRTELKRIVKDLAHVSNNTNKPGTNMVTLRDYSNLENFRRKINLLKEIFNHNQINIVKEIQEVIIFDDNLNLDNEWTKKHGTNI